MFKQFQGEAGFTLIELMIVISVIAILLAMIIPNGAKVQEKSELTVVKKQLKNLRSFNEVLKIEYKNYPSYGGSSYLLPDALQEYLSLEDNNYKYLSDGRWDTNNFDGEFKEFGEKADVFGATKYIIWYDNKLGGRYYYVDSSNYEIQSSAEKPSLP
ncbi:prepilin-type N-terminal cleavage/methylation domain-containing protein [Orenia metallireducens]|jgi:prepilin-type N-terminal cleavage/methylation domain-containing protein|uniref:Prepilin-type N-terminal cleavage/methylation domain-containing protein n=1 Tax=Orenia metallireducens TaxID=1413210 RepID=A0A285F5C6_9FIRM|nr:prepilin-type N-terminal cleavage/methylation domain-containing protein [Orenia metallireducens]PRX34777.1 prepilin-type N-terminal cleavage/methylation domain-containing protein [Orenia metallireducens]SNY05586.1 prepilin-type N-terminal cleavage/methylation domain-containing protein [Orenia metallireducens]